MACHTGPDRNFPPKSTPATHSTRYESHPHSSHDPIARMLHTAKRHIADGKVRPYLLARIAGVVVELVLISIVAVVFNLNLVFCEPRKKADTSLAEHLVRDIKPSSGVGQHFLNLCQWCDGCDRRSSVYCLGFCQRKHRNDVSKSQ